MSIRKSIFKPKELSALMKFRLEAKRSNESYQNSAREKDNSLRYCYETLNKVSRSFAVVIRELPQGLDDAVCLFYLILRALDSIEDDMSLQNDIKIDLLRHFYLKNYEAGWSITGVGDKEEYRELLANYHLVIEAFASLDPKYQSIISDICAKMGEGMADFSDKNINTIKDYDLYCHYVAGLVGMGLSSIFSASGLENSGMKLEEARSNAMGLFLQKTNIVRDYKEDLDERRVFWPKEIWSIYANKLEDFSLQPSKEESLACLNELVNNALVHATDCLDYLKMLRNDRVFRFCAIPQVMAMATLAEVYNNPKVFTENVKIRKGMAASLILNANSIEEVIAIYRKMANIIRSKIPKNFSNSDQTDLLLNQINSYCSLSLQETS